MRKKLFTTTLLLLIVLFSHAASPHMDRQYCQVLRSVTTHRGDTAWKMKKAGEVPAQGETVSLPEYNDHDWTPAIVPGTVLTNLVEQGVYPEPYWGVNNRLESNLIPDLHHTGRDFYTYWFRTAFRTPEEGHKGKRTWLQVDGINYRAEIWVNGKMVGNMAGMFNPDKFDITDYIKFDDDNILAIKVLPVDAAGTVRPKGHVREWGAAGEWHNGGDGEIGRNVSMLMSVGWDFTFHDGIRDRNTGIWKDISIFTTGDLALKNPFIRSELSKPGYDVARQTVSVEIANPTFRAFDAVVRGEIRGEGITFEKPVRLLRGEVIELEFTPEEFPQLVMTSPRLWWPVNKGPQNMYDLDLEVLVNGQVADRITTRFGIREITSDRNSPDQSRTFYVNGRKIFIKGTNWIPEAMLRNSEQRTYAELRYSLQSGINLIRFWGGGITESDYFFQLCDEMGIMVWTEFWMTGDTKHPVDAGLYLTNVAKTVKRIRNHPSLAYYVSSNESTEMPWAKELIFRLDGTRGYQMESECDGVHDGSPYKQVNIMRHYENTASDRGSRVDGFNPEYGAPCLPTVECLREMMAEEDLFPMNKDVWDYMDGNGFHLMSTMYNDMINEYGTPRTLEEYAEKGQFVGAMNYKSIWEVWNYNKLDYGDRYCAGFLYWYHNSPTRQVCGRMWDWSLEPTAALYAAQNACEPLHPQFDYLKNTVSVNNDLVSGFRGYTVTADVYDLNMKKVFSQKAVIDIPEEAMVNDIFTIEFPENITGVHFIALKLLDEKGNKAGSNFYWRSTNPYEGKHTLTGPTTAGFQDMDKLADTRVKVTYKTREEEAKHFIDLNVKNTGKSLSFFTQVQWLDASGSPVRPSFYTDNFFTLLPGESSAITVETDRFNLPSGDYTLVVRGFNIPRQEFKIKL